MKKHVFSTKQMQIVANAHHNRNWKNLFAQTDGTCLNIDGPSHLKLQKIWYTNNQYWFYSRKAKNLSL